MRWAGMAMAYSSPEKNGGAAAWPGADPGLASAIRSDYESVVVGAAGRNPKGRTGGATGSTRRGGTFKNLDESDSRGGSDRFVRIVTTAAMDGNRPPASPPGVPHQRPTGDPADCGDGTDDGDCEGCVKGIVPAQIDLVDSAGQFFLNFGIPYAGVCRFAHCQIGIPISRPA